MSNKPLPPETAPENELPEEQLDEVSGGVLNTNVVPPPGIKQQLPPGPGISPLPSLGKLGIVRPNC